MMIVIVAGDLARAGGVQRGQQQCGGGGLLLLHRQAAARQELLHRNQGCQQRDGVSGETILSGNK